MKFTRWRVLIIAIVIFFLFRPVIHSLLLPWAIRTTPTEQLSYKFPARRELFTGGQNPKDVYGDFYREIDIENNKKRNVYRAYISQNGKTGLSRSYSTVEGRPIFTWLLIDNGKARFISDSSNDGGAPPWAINEFVPQTIKLGFFREGNFIEGEPSATDSPLIVLQVEKTDMFSEYF